MKNKIILSLSFMMLGMSAMQSTTPNLDVHAAEATTIDLTLSESNHFEITDIDTLYTITSNGEQTANDFYIRNKTKKDASFNVVIKDVNLVAGQWASALNIYNDAKDNGAYPNFTVNMYLLGTSTFVGYNHPGIHIDNPNTTVNFLTTSEGAVLYTTSNTTYGAGPLRILPAATNSFFKIGEGTTATAKINDEAQENASEAIEACINRNPDDTSLRGKTLQLTLTSTASLPTNGGTLDATSNSGNNNNGATDPQPKGNPIGGIIALCILVLFLLLIAFYVVWKESILKGKVANTLIRWMDPIGVAICSLFCKKEKLFTRKGTKVEQKEQKEKQEN